jgi:hypothetical protein
MKYYGGIDELKLTQHLYAQSPSFLFINGSRLRVEPPGR